MSYLKMSTEFLCLFLFTSIISAIEHADNVCIEVNDTDLICANIYLTSVPVIEGDFEVLNFYNNLLTTLDKSTFKSYQHAKEINLERNAIENIETDSFHVVPHLRKIDLSYNYLYYIHPDLFLQNSELEIVSLKGNPLVEINTYYPILNAPSVKILDISDCALLSLSPGSFSSLKSLQNLDVRSNNLQHLSLDAISYLENLEIVRLDGNHWICDCSFTKLLNWVTARRPSYVPPLSRVHCYMPESGQKQIVYPGKDDKFCDNISRKTSLVIEESSTKSPRKAENILGNQSKIGVVETVESSSKNVATNGHPRLEQDRMPSRESNEPNFEDIFEGVIFIVLILLLLILIVVLCGLNVLFMKRVKDRESNYC